MRELGPSQIHLWQYAIGDPPDAQHLAHAMTLLSDQEERGCAAFHVDKHRTEYALSHAIVRLVLSEYASVKAQDWRFQADKWGKPEIADAALDAPLYFNLSHTDGLAVCVAGRVRQLGVDVENVNRTVSFLELAKRFFAPIEYECVHDAPPHLRRETFFRIWTLKEAYIKAQGKGLSIPLDSFHFRLLPGSPAQAAIASSDQSDPGPWSFFEFQTALIYRIAVAVRNTGHGEYQVKHHAGAALFNGL